MGVDLKLLVVDGDSGTWGYAHTMLEVGRNYDFHDALRDQHPKPRGGFELHSYVATIPDGGHEDKHGYGKVVDTPYGEPLTYLSSREIVEAYQTLAGDTSLELRAAMAYLRELGPTVQVVLWWH